MLEVFIISLVPRPHLFLEVGLVNNEHFIGCAESAICNYQYTTGNGFLG